MACDHTKSWGMHKHLLTCNDDEAKAVDQGAGVRGVLRGGELVPDAGLLQGQTQAGQSPLQVHTQRQVVLEEPPHHHLGQERHTWVKMNIKNKNQLTTILF